MIIARRSLRVNRLESAVGDGCGTTFAPATLMILSTAPDLGICQHPGFFSVFDALPCVGNIHYIYSHYICAQLVLFLYVMFRRETERRNSLVSSFEWPVGIRG